MPLGFSKKLLPAILCPVDGVYLELAGEISEDEKNIYNGLLRCSSCGSEYIIKDGILNMLVKRDELAPVMRAEIEARDKEAERYDRRLSVRYYKEVVPTLEHVGGTADKFIIEYGCGTGRLTTEIIKRGGMILAVDFSPKSLAVLASKLDGKVKAGLVVADATGFKTAENFFDVALSFQFIEHIPTREQRMTFYDNARVTLNRGGLFINTVYHQDMRRILKKKPQEGKHGSQIFYHYFTAGEIRSELGKKFIIKEITPFDITLPLEARLNFSPRAGGFISRISQKLPLLNKFGHLLLVQAEKNE